MTTTIHSYMTPTMNLVENETRSVSEIIKFLVEEKKPVMMSEVKKKLNKDWNTIRRSFNRLEQIGRVHQKFIGGNKYF